MKMGWTTVPKIVERNGARVRVKGGGRTGGINKMWERVQIDTAEKSNGGNDKAKRMRCGPSVQLRSCDAERGRS
jgi:hypothetical protein